VSAPELALASRGGPPVRDSFLPFARPLFGDEEKRDLLAVLESGWITGGPRVLELESALAAFTGSRHVVCVDSCTAALHVALVLLDLKPGDEVITSPLTFVSTVSAIVHAGGTPVLADLDPATLNLDPSRAAAAVTARTRALLPVHYGGRICAMEPLWALARDRGLTVIEDAAHAVGGTYRGRAAGTLGDLGCLSFYATKNMTTAEGGALLTADAERAARARRLALHGMSRDAWKRYTASGSWAYDVTEPGFKYNMTDLEAALGLHQLRRLPEATRRRREIAGAYDAAFRDHPALEIPASDPDGGSAHHLYPLRLRLDALAIDRARVIDELRAENIGTSVHFIPVHHHTAYRSLAGPGGFPVTDREFPRLISLPLYPAMTDGDVADVIAGVRKVVFHGRRL
jgi:dTDP-4-amino-4,6-dideoxygalactose transaminase